jgi:hypothetical protein
MTARILLGLLLILHLANVSPCYAAFRATETTFIPTGLDADDDGLDDELEGQLGTNPLSADTDGDGWDDLAEIVNGTDPCDPRDFPSSFVLDGGTGTAHGNPNLRLKVAELLSARRRIIEQSRMAPSSEASFSLRYYYLPGNLPDLAVEVRRSDFKAGSFLLMWKHQVRWNPLELTQRYVVTIRREDGSIIAEWTTPAPVDDEPTYVGVPFMLKTTDEGNLITLSLTPESGNQLEYSVADFVAVSAGIEADVNRDGVILDNERPESGKPLRHWLNDDDDKGECQEKADLPGRPTAQCDHAQPGIDGLRDLVDFMPVNLNLQHVAKLMRSESGFRYFISNEDRAIQVVPTGLTPTSAGTIHRNPTLAVFGPDGDGPLGAATVLTPDGKGRIELPAPFVDRISEKGHGIVLLEGARPTSRPLRIEIEKDERAVAMIEQPLSIVPVETMYRHVNLCGASFEYTGQPAAIKEPGRPNATNEPAGLPDSETTPRWVVMVHGYNVSGVAARGWHAETFKRLHALGSNARFVGITWNGDTGLDYHKAVFQAFQAGDAIPRALGFVDSSRTLLIGHSLGNIVAAQAVQAGFTPARYFMLNAALPVEAIVGDIGLSEQSTQMTEILWRPYARRLFASDWSKLAPPGDRRRTYSWSNAFSRVRSLNIATNCYSPGEDVTNCPADMTSASILSTFWSGRAVDYGAWKTQELLKGVGWSRSLGALAMERSQGGWAFNLAWRGPYVPNGPFKGSGGRFALLHPSVAARLSPAQLLKDPFFTPFSESWLHRQNLPATSPLLSSANIRYDLLARAIPAMTFAAGGTALPGGTARGTENFDLETLGRTSGKWPKEGHTTKVTEGRWLHSDFKNVALPLVHPLFTKMIAESSLR